MTPLHQAALDYAARGWALFPCRPGEKIPIGGRGHLDATTDAAQINAWWDVYPNANIGVAVAPSGLCVLDVDVAEGKPGKASLAEMDAQLTDTLTAITGRGGLHVVYQRPLEAPPGRRIGFRPGLDLIGDGYIVVAPSVLADGGQYRWNRLVAPAPLPPVLIAAAAAPKAGVEKVQLTGTPIPEGGRNNAMFKLACALRDTGIGAEALARAMDAENKQRNNPPLDQGELGNIVNSALQRVTVTRDVALGAVLDQQVNEALAPQSKSEWLENIAKTAQPPMMLYSTTFPALDKLIGGFSTRQFTGLIAPPSAGKSALLGHWLLALSLQRPVLHVSLELLRHEIVIRYAAHRLAFPWKDGLYGRVPYDTMANAVRGMNIRAMGAEDFDRVDPWGGIEHEMKCMQEANGGVAPILAIDYIQLMARGAMTDMRHRVGDLTMHARQLSQQFDTVVLGIFTTQRYSYSGKTGEQLKATDDPTAFLAAAKESGDIEFDCATLMFLDVDKLHEGAEKPARIAVARCRIGDVGFVGLRAKLDVGSFEEDAKALVEMSSEARKEKKEMDDVERASKVIIQAIQAMPGRPWRDIQKAVTAKGTGVIRALADKTRDDLIERGIVVEHERYNVRTGKTEQGHSYTIREQEPASDVQPKEDGDAHSE